MVRVRFEYSYKENRHDTHYEFCTADKSDYLIMNKLIVTLETKVPINPYGNLNITVTKQALTIKSIGINPNPQSLYDFAKFKTKTYRSNILTRTHLPS